MTNSDNSTAARLWSIGYTECMVRSTISIDTALLRRLHAARQAYDAASLPHLLEAWLLGAARDPEAACKLVQSTPAARRGRPPEQK